eukprot:6206817-Pleurochrysis_carterae.AAC.1
MRLHVTTSRVWVTSSASSVSKSAAPVFKKLAEDSSKVLEKFLFVLGILLNHRLRCTPWIRQWVASTDPWHYVAPKLPFPPESSMVSRPRPAYVVEKKPNEWSHESEDARFPPCSTSNWSRTKSCAKRDCSVCAAQRRAHLELWIINERHVGWEHHQLTVSRPAAAHAPRNAA